MGVELSLFMERLKAVETDMENMKYWQESQNGTIRRVEDRINKVDEKIDKLLFWMIGAAIGLLGSFVVGLLMFLIEKE